MCARVGAEGKASYSESLDGRGGWKGKGQLQTELIDTLAGLRTRRILSEKVGKTHQKGKEQCKGQSAKARSFSSPPSEMPAPPLPPCPLRVQETIDLECGLSC